MVGDVSVRAEFKRCNVRRMYIYMTDLEADLAISTAGRKWDSRKRAQLWVKQGGFCYWCLEPTKMPFHYGYLRSTGALSGKAATLDHMRSKLSGRRSKSYEIDGFVMACSTCNGNRSREECALHSRLSATTQTAHAAK